MDKNKDIISSVFRNRLKEYEHPVENEDVLWESIERDLSKTKKIVHFYWVKIAISSAAILTALICLSLFFIQHDKNKPDKNLVTQINHPQPQINHSNQEPNQNFQIENERNEGNERNEENKRKEKNMINENNKGYEENQIKEDNEKNERNEEIKKEGTIFLKENTNQNIPIIKKRQKKNLSIGLALGNQTSFPSDTKENNFLVMSGYADKTELDYLAENPTLIKNIDTNTKYNIPVSVGISIRKYFSDSWALESGLTYTYLSSEETTKGENLFFQKDLQLHYLGIPLKTVFSFYNTNRLSMYVTAGGMGEFCVFGKEIHNDVSNKLNINELQWSVMANLGINYTLINHLGLFVEPGVVYYFDDGSGINTIRKSIPFNVNLQAGIRFSY